MPVGSPPPLPRWPHNGDGCGESIPASRWQHRSTRRPLPTPTLLGSQHPGVPGGQVAVTVAGGGGGRGRHGLLQRLRFPASSGLGFNYLNCNADGEMEAGSGGSTHGGCPHPAENLLAARGWGLSSNRARPCVPPAPPPRGWGAGVAVPAAPQLRGGGEGGGGLVLGGGGHRGLGGSGGHVGRDVGGWEWGDPRRGGIFAAPVAAVTALGGHGGTPTPIGITAAGGPHPHPSPQPRPQLSAQRCISPNRTEPHRRPTCLALSSRSSSRARLCQTR